MLQVTMFTESLTVADPSFPTWTCGPRPSSQLDTLHSDTRRKHRQHARFLQRRDMRT